MVSTRLKQMREQSGLTIKELSEASGVPIGTINRALAGQTETSFQTMCDLVKSMGGSLDELAGIPSKSAANGIPEDTYRRVIAEKNNWIKRLFIICCALVTVIVAVLIFDVLNPSIGYFLR